MPAVTPSAASSPATTRMGTPRSKSVSIIGTDGLSKSMLYKTPYRQGISGNASSPSLYRENSPSDARKVTPVQTIFNDLRTAHSSITSGSARSRLRDNSYTDFKEHDNSIPLIDMSPDDAREDISSRNLPLPPSPAALSSVQLDRPESQQNLLASNHKYSTSRLQLEAPAVHTQGNSIFASIRNALASISSPLTKEGETKFDMREYPIHNQREVSEMRCPSAEDDKDSFRPRSSSSPSHEAACDKSLLRGNTVIGNNRSNTPCENESSLHEIGHPASDMNNGPDGEILVASTGPRAQPTDCLAEMDCYPGKTKIPSINYNANQAVLPQFCSGSLLHEESTVGNIYDHYVRNDASEDISENRGKQHVLSILESIDALDGQLPSDDFSSSSPVKWSALQSRRQQRINRSSTSKQGQPPAQHLPELPHGAIVHQDHASNSYGFRQSSSYGDSRKLLEITQPSDGSTHKFTYSLPEIEESSNSNLPYLRSNNPYRRRELEITVSSATLDHEPAATDDEPRIRFDVNERLPLEREVSKALRRVSGCSEYSNGSMASPASKRPSDFPTETSIYRAVRSLITKNENFTPSNLENRSDEQRFADAEAETFYDQQAISANWVTGRQHNAVRVPINHNGAFPDSPPASPPTQVAAPLVNRRPSESDHNDWETIGESTTGRYDSAMLGGTINRAGSSIANTSDAGAGSHYVYALDDLNSMERIAQHPGSTQYSGAYRQRDLKKRGIPIFLPVFREHKVNGYLADSNRLRTPVNPFFTTPNPLKASHTNPFQATPPEVMTAQATIRPEKRSGSNKCRRSQNESPFPVLSLITQPSDDHNEQYNTNPTVGLTRIGPQPAEWIAGSRKSGQVMKSREDPFIDGHASERPDSWQHVMSLAKGDTVPGFGADGPPMSTTDMAGQRENRRSSYYLDSSSILEWQNKAQKDGFVGLQNPSGPEAKKARDRKPLVRGPPGAFYQGLRSGTSQDQTAQNSKSDHKRSARFGRVGCRNTRDYPTNVLRPISLLHINRPATPTNKKCSDGQVRLENDFVYRSPLAPPNQKSWMELYDVNQQTAIKDFAKSDVQTGLRKSIMGFSSKHVGEAPRLSAWRDEPIRTDLVGKQTRFSRLVLILSAALPPMLVLFANGNLDNLMHWWTSQECSSMTKRHKKIALVLLYIWGMAIFISLIVFLVFWFGVERH